MSEEIARTVIYGIAAVAAVVWVVGLRVVIGSVRSSRSPRDEHGTRAGDRVAEAPGTIVRGAAEVEGHAADLSARAAAVLAVGTVGLGQVKVVERTDDRVGFESLGWPLGVARHGKPFFVGVLSFVGSGMGRTRVEYAVRTSRSVGLLRLAVIFLLLGLVAIGLGGWLLLTYVASSQEPSVRGQALQMVQVVHFLWPPFLLAFLQRSRTRWVRQTFDAFVTNLPYLKA